MTVHAIKARRGRPPKSEANRTRELILDAAESIIEEQEPDSLRLNQIAKMVGIQVPTIYGHFKTGRDGVLLAIGERYTEGLSEQFQFDSGEDPLMALKRETTRLVTHLISHPAHVKISLTDLSSPEGIDMLYAAVGGDSEKALTTGPLSAMYQRLDDFLDAGKKAGIFQQNIDFVRFLRSVMGSALISLTWPSHSPLISKDPETIEARQIISETIDLAERLVKK